MRAMATGLTAIHNPARYAEEKSGMLFRRKIPRKRLLELQQCRLPATVILHHLVTTEKEVFRLPAILCVVGRSNFAYFMKHETSRGHVAARHRVDRPWTGDAQRYALHTPSPQPDHTCPPQLRERIPSKPTTIEYKYAPETQTPTRHCRKPYHERLISDYGFAAPPSSFEGLLSDYGFAGHPFGCTRAVI